MTELEFAKKTCLQAGRLLKQTFASGGVRASPKGRNDIVTQADKASQEMIFNAIRKQFPGDALLGEESFNGNIPRHERLWVVDPLDGTVNYEAGLPFYCTSIALVNSTAGYRPIAGAVYEPASGELYHAEKGKGAFLNNKPIHISQRPLREGLVSITMSKDRENMLASTQAMRELHSKVRRFRSIGSIAIESCGVASGRFAAMFNPGGKPWDSAAANLIISEAGGCYSDCRGEPWTLESTGIAAANAQENLKAITNAIGKHLKH